MKQNENSNIYFKCRYNLNLSREQASDLMQSLSPERIERIENEKQLPQPSDVVEMARGYNAPDLCNYYCANQCPIGMQYIPEIKITNLSQIVLEMISSLNIMKNRQERLIDIASDGVIEENEISDFISIQNNLERISITVETLRLWAEKMLANGTINNDIYNRLKSK